MPLLVSTSSIYTAKFERIAAAIAYEPGKLTGVCGSVSLPTLVEEPSCLSLPLKRVSLRPYPSQVASILALETSTIASSATSSKFQAQAQER